MERAGKHRSDLFWYVLIGLLVLFALGVFVVYVPESKRPDRKWAEFAFFSSFLFICLAKFYWRIRRRLKLSLAMLGVMDLHLSVYVPVLSKFEQWPSAAYLVLMPLGEWQL